MKEQETKRLLDLVDKIKTTEPDSLAYVTKFNK